MGNDILAVDVGTTGFKLAVFTPELDELARFIRSYPINVYDRVKADVDAEMWWNALKEGCTAVAEHLHDVGVISFSVTTPGLTPMDEDGNAQGPGVLFFDGRSHRQSRAIRAKVGDDWFLEHACNLPVSGGSSLSSILWIRDEQPEIWERTAMFGHTNTYLIKRLTGEWAIDPSTTSITGLYNTRDNDLTWNTPVLEAAGIEPGRLPPLRHSHEAVGTVLPEVAAELGLPSDVQVLTGGNDAVLAALSGGVTENGEIISIIGTAEITYVCVDAPVASPNFNVRCHVVPDRWLTFFVLNAGGQGFEWFKSVFCSEMTDQEFYEDYLPGVLRDFFAQDDLEEAERHLPIYDPFLGGSRYSLSRLTGSFTGLDLESTRDEMLLAVVRGNAMYSGSHLEEVGSHVALGRRVIAAGTGSKIDALMTARRRWFGDYEFEYRDQSSLHGAALLGHRFLTGSYLPSLTI
jgi:sugar (pentulose or hexulose) kinase